MWSDWLRFPVPIEMESDRSAADCAESFRDLIAESGRLEHQKPYRGYVNADGGEVRQRLLLFGILPARVLKFRLEPLVTGCRLNGELALRKAILFPVGIYLAFCVCGVLWGLVDFTLHGGNVVVELVGPVIGFMMIYGWTYVVVRLNRRQEDQMIKALKHVMLSEQSAAIAADLLSSSR